MLSFPEREKLERVFLAAATQAEGELMGGLGRGLGPQQGWAARGVHSPTLVACLGSRTGCFLLKKQS